MKEEKPINPKCVCGAMGTKTVHGSGMSHVLCDDCAAQVLGDATKRGHSVRIAPFVVRVPGIRGLIPRRVK
jgi:hypothetical protein